MPREIIHAENPGATTELVVQWTPSQHLQLGVQDVQAYDLLDVITGRVRSAERDAAEHSPMHRIARAVEAVVMDYQNHSQGSYDELGGLIIDAIGGNVGGGTGLFIESLSRHGAQQLIKALRRARNQVWGADE